MRNVKRSLVAILAISALAACRSHATVVELRFSGSYAIASGSAATIFGFTRADLPVAFDYRITFDTSIAPPPLFVPAGTILIEPPRTDSMVLSDLFGYSMAGVTALDFTLGTYSWSLDDLILTPLHGPSGPSAHLWFNAEIGSSDPTRYAVRFNDPLSTLTLGGVASVSHSPVQGLELGSRTCVAYDRANKVAFISTQMTLERTVRSTVPDQGSTALYLTGALLVLFAAHRRAHLRRLKAR